VEVDVAVEVREVEAECGGWVEGKRVDVSEEGFPKLVVDWAHQVMW